MRDVAPCRWTRRPKGCCDLEARCRGHVVRVHAAAADEELTVRCHTRESAPSPLSPGHNCNGSRGSASHWPRRRGVRSRPFRVGLTCRSEPERLHRRSWKATGCGVAAASAPTMRRSREGCRPSHDLGASSLEEAPNAWLRFAGIGMPCRLRTQSGPDTVVGGVGVDEEEVVVVSLPAARVAA